MELILCKSDGLPNPGKCARCGNVNTDCVDMGFDIEDDLLAIADSLYGRNAALLCLNCLSEMTQFLPEPEIIKPTCGHMELLKTIGEKVDELASIMSSPASDFGDASEPELELVVDKETTKSKKRTSSTTVKSDESDSVEGPDDVSSSGSDGDSKDKSDVLTIFG